MTMADIKALNKSQVSDLVLVKEGLDNAIENAYKNNDIKRARYFNQRRRALQDELTRDFSGGS